MSDEPKAELARKIEWLASYNGFTIHENPHLAPGWIEFRDENGNILGHINGAKQILVARSRPPQS